ncbi:MAG TPA: hypothetical protein P5136_00750 [Methanofastidiosum sp.]|nr:hypothetical protein [Methanofastidiosum sp.]
MRKLFLDDIREAPDKTWDVVRSYHEFIGYILVYGVPDLISFDHDLEFKSSGYTTPQYTGYDCAKYLVENNLEIKEFTVHSMNPVGRENIIGLLKNWQEFKRNESGTEVGL